MSAARSLIRIPKNQRKGFEFDFFLAHIWGEDEQGGNNHERVVSLGNRLNALGFKAWLDNDQLRTGGVGIHTAMTSGIDSSTLFVVCISRNYIRQVRDGKPNGDLANCQFEFVYAMQRVESVRMVAVVMEDWCKDTKNWSGPVGAVMGSKLYIDFVQDSNLEAVVQRLSDALKQIIPSSTRSDGTRIPRISPNMMPKSISNGQVLYLRENGVVMKGVLNLPQGVVASFSPTGHLHPAGPHLVL